MAATAVSGTKDGPSESAAATAAAAAALLANCRGTRSHTGADCALGGNSLLNHKVNY